MKFQHPTYLVLISILFLGTLAYSQEKDNLKTDKKAKKYVYSGNQLLEEDQFVLAEMEFRQAISLQPDNVVGAYNLGNSYYNNGNYDEALYRHQQALKNATSKTEKHYAFHNIGNILMQEKKCIEAAEAFKNALKNNPADDETRYNYALAKKCAEEQQKQDNQEDKDQDKDKENNQDQNKDNQDQNKDKQDNSDKNKDDKQDKGEKDKDKEGDQKEDKNDNQKNKDPNQKPKQQPGQLSPQQIKNLLEAMNAQEQKVQEKINAEKQKGIKIKTEKDW
ncbi:MAG TPA: tetratricopeptide repeat protein [Flavobacteriaceae bacterium]|nr:tetratricopeptide repeat protein [Flavobacteriaceae bacterium]